MDFVENIRVSEKCPAAGFGAEQDHPPAIQSAGEIGGVRVAKEASAQGDETAMMPQVILLRQ